MNQREVLEKYKAQSVHYLENAYKSIDAGDSEKASEFLWGSMAEAIKAVAATKGVTFRGHRQLWDYAESLSKELDDKSIFDSFLHANSLHSNFYESELELKDVIRIADEVRMTVGK
ncbi:unnamed protein product, partial [marine sediment metagenome]